MPRLVVFELHHLGDAVMALPFLRGARKGWTTEVVCRSGVAEFLRPALPGLTVHPTSDRWTEWLPLAKRLCLGPEDAAACVWADSRVHLAMTRTGAGVRVGFPMTAQNYYASGLPWRRRRMAMGRLLTAWTRIQGRGPALTLPLNRAALSQHHMSDWEQVAKALGVVPDDRLPWIGETVGELPEEVNQFWPTPSDRPRVLIHPGGRLATKRWPGFPDLLRNLAARADLSIVIATPPGEPAPEAVGPHQMRLTCADWTTLLAVTRAADAVVCNDSFPGHLAAAVGKPVVTIFGSGNPDWFAPWRNDAHVVKTEACPHRPCIDRCVMPSTVCLESVPVAEVETRLRTVLNQR